MVRKSSTRNVGLKIGKRRRKVASSFEIGPGHKGAQRNQKIYNKGKGTSNPHEKDTFLKRTGPQLPLVKRKSNKRYG